MQIQCAAQLVVRWTDGHCGAFGAGHVECGSRRPRDLSPVAQPPFSGLGSAGHQLAVGAVGDATIGGVVQPCQARAVGEQQVIVAVQPRQTWVIRSRRSGSDR
ncbi:hypothetical protein GCM10010411_53690 [Actinomadura fulvescens]|uniref:Uncharacterized protein n=1 Tax=Actinomadura fulvescens TaxID=46160 RepID=A0ABN3Q1L1_9ACTN